MLVSTRKDQFVSLSTILLAHRGIYGGKPLYQVSTERQKRLLRIDPSIAVAKDFGGTRLATILVRPSTKLD